MPRLATKDSFRTAILQIWPICHATQEVTQNASAAAIAMMRRLQFLDCRGGRRPSRMRSSRPAGTRISRIAVRRRVRIICRASASRAHTGQRSRCRSSSGIGSVSSSLSTYESSVASTLAQACSPNSVCVISDIPLGPLQFPACPLVPTSREAVPYRSFRWGIASASKRGSSVAAGSETLRIAWCVCPGQPAIVPYASILRDRDGGLAVYSKIGKAGGQPLAGAYERGKTRELPDCKPVSVPLRAAVIPLGRTLLAGSSDLPGSRAGRAVPPPLFGLAPRGVCPAGRNYSRRGALLPHHFTLTPPCGEAVYFLWHFPSSLADLPGR